MTGDACMQVHSAKHAAHTSIHSLMVANPTLFSFALLPRALLAFLALAAAFCNPARCYERNLRLLTSRCCCRLRFICSWNIMIACGHSLRLGHEGWMWEQQLCLQECCMCLLLSCEASYMATCTLQSAPARVRSMPLPSPSSKSAKMEFLSSCTNSLNTASTCTSSSQS
jgi:hypothetical protein